MWRYGIGEPPPPPKEKETGCRKEEKDKQYETKYVWIVSQSWLVGNKGISNLPPPQKKNV